MKYHALFVIFEKGAKFEIVVCCKLSVALYVIFFISGLDYLGSCLDIQCTDEHVTLTLTKQGPVKLNIFLYKSSKSELLSLGHVCKLPRQKFAVKSSSATHGSNFSTLMMGFAVFFTKTLVSILRSF